MLLILNYNNCMKKIYLCTFNENKILELTEFCKRNYKDYSIILLRDIDKEFDDPIENGRSYEENAKLKATSYKLQLEDFDLLNEEDLVLTEDSGIEGINSTYPGIHSKREVEIHGFLPVLKELIKRNGDSTDVKYISIIATIDYNENYILREAEELGTLLLEPRGENNYYLDRFFISKVRGPLGELEPEEYLSSSFRLNAKIKD